jgi:hypothetical protein
MGAKGTTKRPFWAKARREYTCFNCAERIAEGEDVLIFQPVTIHALADTYRTPWQFACGECGDWEVPRPIPNKGEIHSYGGSYVQSHR